jgi:adenine-specific DNA-methyltransferase
VVRENETVLDFFSGSGSTAEALMEYATDRKIKCNYIMVQIPESIEKDSRAYTAGYKNICEIGKERIRRAAKKIKEDKITTAKNDGIFADFTDDQDYGFRVYRLDESNMQDVYYKPQDYVQSSLDLFADNVKADRTADDLLTQVILDWGLPLSLKIEKVEISGKQVFKVAENSLFACFDKGIDEDFAKELASEKPLRVVFKDNAFKDDTAKTNVKQLLKQLSPNTEMKVI